MAIQRIPGELLQSNLTRSGVDLAFETNLLYLDVSNGRIGIGTDSPGAYKLDVNGTARFQNNVTVNGDLTVTGETTTVDSKNLSVEDNILTLNSGSSTATSAGIMINRGSAGNPAVLYWDESNDKFKLVTTTSDGSTTSTITDSAYAKLAGADPSAADDFVTKRYFEANSAGGTLVGTNVTVGTPADSSFGDGALVTLGTASSVTDALDDLNETMENIRNSTYVKSVNFTADVTAGSAGITVTLTITTVGGGADRYNINWGTGETATNATSDSTPSHTYSSNTNSPFTITVRAYNSSATSGSAGSFAEKTRTNYITIYTAQPVPNFFMYAASSGGSAITKANTGATVYLENTSTNTGMASVTYTIDWGDSSEQTIASDGAAGGVGGGRLAHTYTNSAGDDGSTIGTGTGDTRYTPKLVLRTHTTADPSAIPATATKNFDVYSAHTAAYSAAGGVVRGINEESTSGFPVTFTNNTATNPGAQSTFSSNVYTWNFGEGGSNTNVNVGSNASGDTSRTIANTFNLSTAQQNAKTTVTFNTSLSLANGHTGSPYAANLNIIVEPDLRANIAGTANIVSSKSGDNQYDLYDVTDLDGANRALTTFTNTSQHADNYFYDFKDDSSDTLTVVENGSNAGSIGATLGKNWAGVSAGNYKTTFRAYGTPDTIFQDDVEEMTWTMNSTPSAPANLSSKSLTLSDSAQGSSPKLCHGFDDNSGAFTSQSPGDSLNTSTSRRYTNTSVIDTNTVSNFLTNNCNGTGSTVNQTLTAKVNNVAGGSRTFTTSEGGGNNMTDATLVTTNHRDADEIGAYPQRMFLVATAKMALAIGGYSVGSSAQRLESSAGGNTNIVHVVKDDVTASPTTTIGTITQNAAGSLRYVSGVPYYNTGSPSLTVTGSTIANFTGQAYKDTSSPVEIDPGTNQESTSGNIISNLNFTYANVDGSTTMLNSGTPKADTGVGSAYTLGAITVPLLSTQRRSIQQIKMRASNCNGTSSYSESSTKIQLYTNTLTPMDNEQGGMTVSDSLGATYDDDALRIYDFASDTTDTPSYNGSTNFYTNNLFTGNKTVAGTREAISRFGTIKHFTTNLSSGYLPVGPDLNTGRSGAQYFTIAFRRSTVSQFSMTLSGKVSGVWIALPGEGTDTSSGANGWLDCSTQYNGAGLPGSGSGGNGSDGVAKTGGDRIIDNTTYSSQTFDMTLGTGSMSNSTGNVCLVRFKLESGDSITDFDIGTV